MDNVEMAQDSLEHAHGAHGHGAHGHGHGHGRPGGAGQDAAARLTRSAAVLVAVIAAVAVVVEMSGNDQQTAYLAHDVEASDLWAQYQGKSVRHTVLLQTATLLDAQKPGQPAAASARDAAARLADDPGHDGMRQLSLRATAEQRARDHALHLHEGLERSVRGLQIAIVLIGLFMATRLIWLLGLGAVLGAGAFAYGIAAGSGVL